LSLDEISTKYSFKHEKTKQTLNKINEIYDKFDYCKNEKQVLNSYEINNLIKSNKYESLPIEILFNIYEMRLSEFVEADSLFKSLKFKNDDKVIDQKFFSFVLVINWFLGFLIVCLWMILSQK